MNAIDLLEEQHRGVDSLFERLAAATKNKQALFNELADLLAIHAAIEERHFYPAVRARRTEDILLESLAEHLAIKRALADLIMLPVSDELFDSKLTVLKEEVQHHVKEERSELFPKVRRILSRDLLEGIGQEMTGTMAELQDRPLPPRADVPLQIGKQASLAPHGAGADLLGNLFAFVSAPVRLLAGLMRSAGTRRPKRRHRHA